MEVPTGSPRTTASLPPSRSKERRSGTAAAFVRVLLSDAPRGIRGRYPSAHSPLHPLPLSPLQGPTERPGYPLKRNARRCLPADLPPFSRPSLRSLLPATQRQRDHWILMTPSASPWPAARVNVDLSAARSLRHTYLKLALGSVSPQSLDDDRLLLVCARWPPPPRRPSA